MSNIKIDFTAGDPEPNSIEERKAYVAKVAGFYQDVGKDKLNYLINNLAKDLINPDLPDEENQKIKLTINGISLLLDWMEQMTSEHVGDSLSEEIEDEDVFTN